MCYDYEESSGDADGSALAHFSAVFKPSLEEIFDLMEEGGGCKCLNLCTVTVKLSEINFTIHDKIQARFSRFQN